MTIIAAVRVPAQGAVLIADGLVTEMDGRVCSSTAKKLLQMDAATIAVAGNLMVLEELKNAKLKTADAVKEHLRKHGYATQYELICYDHIRDEMWTLNQDGVLLEHSLWSAEGVGGQIASGALMMAEAATTLEDALVLAKQVVEITCTLNGRCGGAVHWYTCEPLFLKKRSKRRNRK